MSVDNPVSAIQVLSQRAVGQQIIKHLSILDRWSCLQVFPTWRGLEAIPVILAQGSEVSRSKIVNQFTKSEEQSALIVRDERGLALFISILKTFPLICSPFNLVSLDLCACDLLIDDLNSLLSGANFPAFANLESISANLQQVTYFHGDSQTIWNGNTPVLEEPISPLPRLKSLNIMLIPKLSINSTPLAKLMRLSLNASEITLRDRDNSAPWRANFFSWYVRPNFPQKYPNLKQLSVSIYSEFLSVLMMESNGDYKSWFPALKKLIICAQCNYIKLQDLEEYQNIFKDIAVEVPPYTRFLD
ncbi:hypothetical protein Aperf_G00000060020 [Anoplocephala perfoliata]